MCKRPLILVSAGIESKGSEFSDPSLSLSLAYERALLGAGMIPLVMPTTAPQEVIAECVRRADGVLFTGGEDVNPALYAKRIPARLRRTVTLTPDEGVRDLREVFLVAEVFRQRKPLLAICRGQQVLNVALGGTLVVDIGRQIPGALNHRRSDRRARKVHEVSLTPGALLAKITGKRVLGVNSTHHQAVDQPAGVLTVAARSADGVIEALELTAEATRLLPFLLSVQFHPERLVDRHPEHQAIFAAFAQACARKRQ
ncbi:MAG: gamma-glutamyl-gamma-aminobutyrate hydrolase family protein [Verrucomicrobia subdivision 3 bacterium]|nr:gamma-glutamyl-gamma-aminobutyrate hydrolase family protein [Limisphaerales bacterium]